MPDLPLDPTENQLRRAPTEEEERKRLLDDLMCAKVPDTQLMMAAMEMLSMDNLRNLHRTVRDAGGFDF